MRIRLIARATFLVILLLAAGVWSPVRATNLTGTFKHPDGTPVDGKLVFLLSQPARLNDGSAQVVPMVKIFSVANGQLEAGAFVYGNDVLLPGGTYYLVRLVDSSNNLLFEQKWSIQGTDLDLGTLTPTTTGVVVPDPLLKNLPTDQSVEGPVTFTSPLTAFTLTLNGNLNPGSPESYNLGSPALSWRELYLDALRTKGSPWFDVRAYGAAGDNATNDTAAFQAAISACVAQGGGTVFVPMQTAGTVYRVPGPLTFTSPASGWCRLLIQGDIILADVNGLNGNGLSVPRRWVIEGLGNKTYTHGTYTYDAQASINGGTSGSYDVITVTSGPAVIRNIKVQNVRRHGINIDATTGANIKLENVNVAKSDAGGAAGSPLRVANVQWVIVRDSAFLQSGPDTSPAIEITTSGRTTGNMTFKNITIYGRTIKLTGTPTTAEVGALTFENIISEALADEGVFTVDTKPGANGIAWRGLSFLDITCADAALPGGCALLKSSPTNNGGLIEAVVVRNPAFFAQGIFKPDPTKGPQEIQGLIVEGIQNSSGAMPIGQHDQYWATFRNQVRQGTTYVDETFKVLMPRPTGVTATPSASGGSLADGTYHIVVTALDADGSETYISDEKSATISGSGGSGKIDIAWTAVPGAVSYRIYGPSGTAGGGAATFYSTQNKPRYGTSTTNSFTYSAALPNTGNPPTLLTDSGNAAAIKMLSNGTARFTGQIETRVATGTAPFVVTSTTEVANLNAQRWHGKEALDFSASLDFASIVAQSCSELTLSVTSASVNSAVAPAWPASLEAGLAGTMRVSASGTVAVRLCNVTAAAIDPATQTFGGRVIQ